MDTEELIRDDLILMLLAAPTRWEQAQDRINGITRLEKLLFLVDQELTSKLTIIEPFDFTPYHYGPYSRAIYEAVELLKEAGLIREHRKLTDPELDRAEELLYSDMTNELSYERRFCLTTEGEQVANYLRHQHPKLQKEIGCLKDRYAGFSLHNLIYHVYTQYPSYTERSVIRDEIIGQRR